ncbi:MAG: hypothetical protein ACRDVL_01685 [Acidimicrobiia bacterium]
MRRPLTGALLGIVVGVAVAVLLQQHGIWPLDKLGLFLFPAITGLLGMLATTVGRVGDTWSATAVIALVLTLGMAIWGLTGLTEIGENGQLNGGCTVEASSDIDDTLVTDTSRGNPFSIDPDGGLNWVATSPGPIQDHTWEIWIDVGGFPVTIDSGGDPNTDGDPDNTGDVSDVTEYSGEQGIPIDELRGVFEVGGDISGDGGACDGFGFVELVSEPLETITAKIALGVAVLALIGLMVAALTGREVEPVTVEGRHQEPL